jgi:hypothetical protein
MLFSIAIQEARRATVHRRSYHKAHRNLAFELRSGDKVQHRSLRKDVKATERTFDKLEDLTPSLTGALLASTLHYATMQLEQHRLSVSSGMTTGKMSLHWAQYHCMLPGNAGVHMFCTASCANRHCSKSKCFLPVITQQPNPVR